MSPKLFGEQPPLDRAAGRVEARAVDHARDAGRLPDERGGATTSRGVFAGAHTSREVGARDGNCGSGGSNAERSAASDR